MDVATLCFDLHVAFIPFKLVVKQIRFHFMLLSPDIIATFFNWRIVNIRQIPLWTYCLAWYRGVIVSISWTDKWIVSGIYRRINHWDHRLNWYIGVVFPAGNCQKN